MQRIAGPFLVVVFLCGCSTSEVTRVEVEEEHPPTKAADVAVHGDEKEIERPHSRIAELSAIAKSRDGAERVLRKKAAELGAHALVMERGNSGAEMFGNIFRAVALKGDRELWRAVAYRYK